MDEFAVGDPIVILGVAARCGTNFLWDLLRLHPDCAIGRSPITEDYFLHHVDRLLDYAVTVHQSWDPHWGDFPVDVSDRLLGCLGLGLTSFLRVDPGKRLLIKTPSVRNLEHFFQLFPQGDLLILMRDGRSVAQSSMATFGWDLETAARGWIRAANRVHRFDEVNRDQGLRYRLVRYEDLVDDLRPTLSAILDFLGLDRGVYDFEAAENLPVRGSSASSGHPRAPVHWEPVPRTPDFAPTGRWRSWSVALQDRFIWLAHQQLLNFGYEAVGPVAHTPARAIRHRLLDWRWRAAELMRAKRRRRSAVGGQRHSRSPATT